MNSISSGSKVFQTDEMKGKLIMKTNTPRSYVVNTGRAIVQRKCSPLRTVPSADRLKQKIRNIC